MRKEKGKRPKERRGNFLLQEVPTSIRRPPFAELGDELPSSLKQKTHSLRLSLHCSITRSRFAKDFTENTLYLRIYRVPP